jgi:hypothetical protein
MHIKPLAPGTVVTVRQRNQYHTAPPLKFLAISSLKEIPFTLINKKACSSSRLFWF